MNTSRITRPVELTFDGWTFTHDMDCIVNWDYDAGDSITPPFLEVGKVECQDAAATVHACIIKSWAKEFPDTPCPFTVADVTDALDTATEQVADAVDISDLSDANIEDMHAEDRAEIARWEMEND